jgi:hypothetical protein
VVPPALPAAMTAGTTYSQNTSGIWRTICIWNTTSGVWHSSSDKTNDQKSKVSTKIDIREIKVSQTQLSIIGVALIGFVDVYWCLAGRHVSTPSSGHKNSVVYKATICNAYRSTFLIYLVKHFLKTFKISFRWTFVA